MAFFHQLHKQQGINRNSSTISWGGNQNVYRDYEADRIQLERQLAQGRIEAEMQIDASKIENKRYVRKLARLEHERTIEEAIIQVQTARQLATEARNEDHRLASELERVKLEKIRDEKMRQQIRETSYEIRDLESKLRAGYVQKALTAQMAEKEALKFDSYLADVETARRIRSETEKAELDRRQHEAIRQQEMIRYKQELERQLEEQVISKQKAYEEFLREKLVIDDIVRKIYEEDQREMERKLERQRVTREQMIEFKRKREQWKAMESQRMEEENRRIIEEVKAHQQHEDLIKAEKRARQQKSDRIRGMLGEQIRRNDEEREEQEILREQLQLEEHEQAVRRRERAEMAARIRKRLELQRERDEHIQLKHIRGFEIQKEENRFRQQLMAKFAEDDRIEQMNGQRRRLKQLEHKKAVDNLLEQRRRQLALNRQHEINERIEAEHIEKVRKEIIEEERIKLLREHAHRLLGNLPKGVIRDESDLDYLGNDFRNEFQQRQISIQNPGGWS